MNENTDDIEKKYIEDFWELRGDFIRNIPVITNPFIRKQVNTIVDENEQEQIEEQTL